MAHLSVRRQALAHFGEVNRPTALMNLNRVSAAECDVRPACSREVYEIMLLAGSTAGTRLAGGHFGVFIPPEINRDQGATKLGLRADQELQGFAGCKGGNEINRRI